MNKRNISLYLLIVVALFSSFCSGIELVVKLDGRDESCFYDSLGGKILMQMKVSCSQPEHLNFSITQGSHIIYDSSQQEVKESNISFQTITPDGDDGDYAFCFENSDYNEILLVSFSYLTGVEAKDYKDLLQKDEADKLTLRAQRLEDTLHDIGEEKKLIIRHQQYNSSLSKDISFKIQGFSIVTAVVLLALGIFQSYYIRQFLKQKKII